MKKSRFTKAYSNNYLKLYQLAFHNDGQFFTEIKRISDLFNLPTFDFIALDPSKFKNGDNFKNLLTMGRNKTEAFLKKLTVARKIKLFKEIESSRVKLKLGKEWNSSILRIIASGVYLPPPFGVFYEENEENEEISFIINKDTTKLDLDLAWDASADLRKKLFGKQRSFYATKKTVENLNLNADSIIKKLSLKQKGLESTDMALAVELFPNPDDYSEMADLRLVNKIRTNRHRQKKKLN